MLQKIISRYKRVKTNRYLAHNYEGNYAFVGFGQHSLNNLYPVLNYLQVPLKYICVTSDEKAKLINQKFNGIKATTSLDDILNDDSIKGVFVSTTPSAHFKIAKKVLQHGKNLFIEKPPCASLEELNELIDLCNKQSNLKVLVGLQKRFAPCTQILKQRLSKDKILNYSMRYCTGKYPEGNALLDLYIHPIDLAIYIFGNASIIACEKSSANSYIIMLKHDDFVGTLELSTDYSWENSIETLSVCTQKGIYEMSKLEELTYCPKQTVICGVPIEKIIKRNSTIENLFHRNNFSPILVNNQIYTQGFYDEIKYFVDCVEDKKLISISNLRLMWNTYNLIGMIQNK